MLEIRTTLGELRVGDTFRAMFTDHQPETITRVYAPDTAGCIGGTFETDKHNAALGSTWNTTGSDLEVLLVATARDVSDRILEDLKRFPDAVRLAVACRLCPRCGGIDCREHL